ncbi:ferredoxin [Mycolicibacterium komossense]|uniref:Ferredoxin n=1 Tax=Mycolicibacterium komossense TaxID=1779 RepID=A0ABT3CKJ0_9MYCO|nr:ferredoxin [Mycolicibacterium komossense]MCV7230004.1 ferredoxin [Mycolicibacterium komossense]
MSYCRVTIDRSRCTGIGLCEAAAPDLFEIDDDGVAQLIGADVGTDRLPELEEAASNCPTQSIAVSTIG